MITGRVGAKVPARFYILRFQEDLRVFFCCPNGRTSILKTGVIFMMTRRNVNSLLLPAKEKTK